MVTIIVMIQ